MPQTHMMGHSNGKQTKYRITSSRPSMRCGILKTREAEECRPPHKWGKNERQHITAQPTNGRGVSEVAGAANA